jgi:hypothetical protein
MKQSMTAKPKRSAQNAMSRRRRDAVISAERISIHEYYRIAE